MGDRLIDVLREAGADVADADGIVTAFVDWADRRGTTLYPHQEEAILELYTGANVVLATPTGSGKSLVALAAHAASVCGGGRSWYTAPVKALVSERARPGVVNGLGVWWRKFGLQGTNVNQLTSQQLTDLGRGPVFYDCLVEVRAA